MISDIKAAAPKRPSPETPEIATATASSIRRVAEKLIEDIEAQRDQAKSAFMDFDAAATEAQKMIRVRAATIAENAEKFMTSMASSALAVRRIGNDVATFGDPDADL